MYIGHWCMHVAAGPLLLQAQVSKSAWAVVELPIVEELMGQFVSTPEQFNSVQRQSWQRNWTSGKWIVMGWWSRNVPSRYTAYDSKRRSTNFRKQAKLQRTRRCTKRGCLSRKQLLPLRLENCNFLISESSTEGWGGQGQKVTWQPGSQGHGTRKPALGSRDYGHPQFKTNWTMIQELSWCSRPFTSFVSP